MHFIDKDQVLALSRMPMTLLEKEEIITALLKNATHEETLSVAIHVLGCGGYYKDSEGQILLYTNMRHAEDNSVVSLVNDVCNDPYEVEEEPESDEECPPTLRNPNDVLVKMGLVTEHTCMLGIDSDECLELHGTQPCPNKSPCPACVF